MKLDPTKMQDWQIAAAAEESMKPPARLAAEMGLKDQELLPYGRQLARVDFAMAYARLKGNPSAKYIDVTAITPTPLGEGKTVTTIGATQALCHIGKNAIVCIRQPSLGPVFGIKGGAAGGGVGCVGDLQCFLGPVADAIQAHAQVGGDEARAGAAQNTGLLRKRVPHR